MHRAFALGDFLVGVFDHDDGAVDQHPHGEDQAEHDDVRDRHAHHRQEREAQQERGGDGEADQKGGADAERGQRDDHHQRDGGQHRAFELRNHRGDDTGLIVGGVDLHRDLKFGRPGVLGLGHGVAHQGCGVDDVEALALDHLQGNRRLAVEAGGAGAVLEGQVDARQIAQRDDAVAIGLDRKVVDVAGVVE